MHSLTLFLSSHSCISKMMHIVCWIFSRTQLFGSDPNIFNFQSCFLSTQMDTYLLCCMCIFVLNTCFNCMIMPSLVLFSFYVIWQIMFFIKYFSCYANCQILQQYGRIWTCCYSLTLSGLLFDINTSLKQNTFMLLGILKFHSWKKTEKMVTNDIFTVRSQIVFKFLVKLVSYPKMMGT